ncbi:MAG: hypothetical protein GY856_38165, partial [bacterium]|nr:hypothetical protein [bacterium]
EGTTPFMTLLAAFQALLGIRSGQDDFAVGTAVAGRNLAEIEGLIGFFVNTLVLRADLSGWQGQTAPAVGRRASRWVQLPQESGESKFALVGPGKGGPSFRELLARVRETALGAFTHQELPFEKLVEELDPERNLSINPLFQVFFVFQGPSPPPLELAPELRVEIAPVDVAEAKFDLFLGLGEDG